MKIIDKVCGKIGLIDSDEEKKLKEEIEQEEQEVEEEDEEEVSKFERSEGQPEVSARNVVDFTSAASARENGGNLKMKVIVIEPQTFEDAQQVAYCLRAKRPVVINFENTDGDDARRIIDFISGTTYALNGEIKKVGHDVFFCAPSNVNVTYTEEERKVSTEMPWLKK